jgi:hypothetical protein
MPEETNKHKPSKRDYFVDMRQTTNKNPTESNIFGV